VSEAGRDRHQPGQPPLELPPVDEPRQAIVRCVERQLATHPPIRTLVPDDEHRAGDRSSFVPNWCVRVADRDFSAIPAAQHHAVLQVDGPPAPDALHRDVGDSPPRGFGDERQDHLQGASHRLPGCPPGQPFGGGIQVRNAAGGVRRDDGIADRRQRRPDLFSGPVGDVILPRRLGGGGSELVRRAGC
jgi:hypothetical protein